MVFFLLCFIVLSFLLHFKLPYNIALSICVSLSAHLSGSPAQGLYPWIFSFSVTRQYVGFSKYSVNTYWMNKWMHILALTFETLLSSLLRNLTPRSFPSLPKSDISLSLSTTGFLFSTFIYFLSYISLAHCISMIALLHMMSCSSFMES